MFQKIDTDKILGTGLVIALILYVVGNVTIVLFGEQPLSWEIANSIVSCLAGYMGRSLLENCTKGANHNENLH